MKISNWSILGFLGAAVYGGVTIYQYWIKYNDVSQFLMNMAIACLIGAVSWLYNRQIDQGNDIMAIENYLSELDKELRAKLFGEK